MPLYHINLPPVRRYLTVKEVAKILEVTPLTLRNWDKKGKLMAYRHPINNYRIYKAEDIEFFLREIESQGKISLG
ncbi:MerR family DNA-binding transcriptional regulator [Patescibacteria group bacterium]|nr:MerR family DNA-binding transcriptional regulator [Patescibacteria group bacterium]